MTDNPAPWSSPDWVGKWVRLLAPLFSYLLAVFLVVYATLNATELGMPLVAAMFTLAAGFLGTPEMLRMDRARRESANGEDK